MKVHNDKVMKLLVHEAKIPVNFYNHAWVTYLDIIDIPVTVSQHLVKQVVGQTVAVNIKLFTLFNDCRMNQYILQVAST